MSELVKKPETATKKTVRILGLAANLSSTPAVSLDSGIETWGANYHGPYYARCHWLRENDGWTRWFNIHSKQYMQRAYPHGYEWYKQWDRPIYLRHVEPDVPGSIEFPRKAIQDYFGGPQMGSPGRFFTFTGGWLTAFAIMEGFQRIEFWGFRLADKPPKPHECYKFERPCFWYWVQRARDLGIEVAYQKEIEAIPFEPGDPAEYTGALYGYGTNKPYEE